MSSEPQQNHEATTSTCNMMCSSSRLQPNQRANQSKSDRKFVSSHIKCSFLPISIYTTVLIHFYITSRIAFAFTPPIRTQPYHISLPFYTRSILENEIPYKYSREMSSLYFRHNSENENKSINANSNHVSNEEIEDNAELTIKKLRSYAVSINRLRKIELETYSGKSYSIRKDIAPRKNAPIATSRSFVKALQQETARFRSIIDIYETQGLPSANDYYNKQDSMDIFTNQQTLSELKDALNYATIQSIRAFADAGDFVWILKVVDAVVDYATGFAITSKIVNMQMGENNIDSSLLQPRIFGEAITGLAKGTKASISKIRYVWNVLISVANSTNEIEDNFMKEKLSSWRLVKESKIGMAAEKDFTEFVVSVLDSPPSAFELNSMINALASRDKIRAALNLYVDVTKVGGITMDYEKVSGNNMNIISIDIDAYTVSILFNILTESIHAPDPTIINDVYVSNTSWFGGKGSKHKRKKDKLQRESPCWQWREALNILDYILRFCENTQPEDGTLRNKERYLNNHVFSSMLKINEKASELFHTLENRHDGAQVAMGVLQIMRKIKISPDVVTCSAVMSAFDKGQQWKAAIALFNAMEKADNEKVAKETYVEDIWILPAPNVYTYAAAISACARCGEGEVALQLLDTMKNVDILRADKNDTLLMKSSDTTNSEYSTNNISPNRWVYNSALAACAYSKNTNLTTNGDSRLDMALRIIDQMEHDSLNGCDTAPDTVSFNTALAAVGGFKDIYKDQNGDVICTFINEDDISSLNPKHTLLRNEEDVVLNLLNKMKGKNLSCDTITYRNAILACRSNSDAVLRILNQALNDDDLLKNIVDGHESNWRGKIYVMNAALSACASNGDMASMARIFQIFNQHNVEANINSMSQIIRSLGVSGNSNDLMLVLNAMKGDSVPNQMFGTKYGINIIENIGGTCPMIDESHYSAAITAALKQGELFLALKVLHAMKLHGLNPSENSLQAIIFSYCNLAMDMSSKEAKEARKKAAKRKGKSYVFNIDYTVSSTRASAAFTMMNTLKKPSPKLQAAVSISCAAAGMWLEGRTILRTMHKSALLEVELEKMHEPALSTQGSTLAELPHLHRSLLKLCARSGNVTAALWYIDDIQSQSLRLASMDKSVSEDSLLNVRQYQTKLEIGENSTEDMDCNIDKLSNISCLVRGIGMTGEDWKLLMIAASKSAHWKVCMGTLQFIRPFIEETHPRNALESAIYSEVYDDEESLKTYPRKPLKSLNRQYEKLARALTAAMLCFETRSQYAWAIRAINDWIEWSGRQPRKEAVFSACRLLARRGKCSEILSLVKAVTCSSADPLKLDRSTEKGDVVLDYEQSYGRAVYTEAISTLYSNGLYDTADELYASAVYEGYLPWPVIEQKNKASQLKIDLHGMNRALAHSAVRVALQQEIQATSWQINGTVLENDAIHKLDKDVIIVTGKGKRSAQHLRPVIRPEVQRMLQEEFYPPLGTSSIPGNMGALAIPVSDVKLWLKHQKEQKGIRLLAVAGILKNISSGNRLRQLLTLNLNDSTGEDNTDSNEE